VKSCGWRASVDFFALFAQGATTKFAAMSSVAAAQFMPVVATASAKQDSLVVSLHDVAPSSRETCESILSELTRIGVSACSLLVVPDYHHQGLATEDRQFISWLRELQDKGHEIVIHGFFHERPRRTGETPQQKAVTRFYTNDEGEFYDLDYEEALRRITTARDAFRAHGLTPRGFIAPAWLLNRESEKAAGDAEMEYTTRLRSVRDLRSGQDYPAFSLVYSVRNEWRRATSLAWNWGLYLLIREKPLVRVSIHPPDYSHSAVWGQIVDLTRELASTRTSTTYRDWIGEQRVAANAA
jgi:predicted deacetylase